MNEEWIRVIALLVSVAASIGIVYFLQNRQYDREKEARDKLFDELKEDMHRLSRNINKFLKNMECKLCGYQQREYTTKCGNCGALLFEEEVLMRHGQETVS